MNELCKHNREKKECKTCKGYCEHKRRRSQCIECGGTSICEHKRQRSRCVECGGGSICEHKRQRSQCVDCQGTSVCEHKRRRSSCLECKGTSVCEHKRQRSQCVDCQGGSICEHKRQRSSCVDCEGGNICEHKRRRCLCLECEPILYLINLQRSNIYRIMKKINIKKTQHSIEYLGCSAIYFKEYISKKMTIDMTFDNIHYDHIKPVSVFDLNNHEELLKCCHYTNFQPLIATDNLEKSNKWNHETELFWRENICGKEYNEIYNPFK
jgi:hypothetical protein